MPAGDGRGRLEHLLQVTFKHERPGKGIFSRAFSVRRTAPLKGARSLAEVISEKRKIKDAPVFTAGASLARVTVRLKFYGGVGPCMDTIPTACRLRSLPPRGRGAVNLTGTAANGGGTPAGQLTLASAFSGTCPTEACRGTAGKAGSPPRRAREFRPTLAPAQWSTAGWSQPSALR